MDTTRKVNITVKRDFFNDIFLKYPLGDGTTENLLTSTKRLIVLYGGAGSGKSRFGVQRSIYKALKSKRKFLVVRKVTNTIRDSIFAEFKEVLSQFRLLEHCKVSESNFTIKLPNGSEFIFKGIDDPERIKSISGLTDLLLEEATELTLDDFTQLSLRLRSRKGNDQILLMYNPVSKTNWVYKHFHEGQKPDNCIVAHTNYLHNKFLPQSYIDSLQDMMRSNPVYYKIYALGQFASLSRTVYTDYKVLDFNYHKLLKEGHKAYFSVDFGYTNDPTAFMAIIADEVNKRLYVFDEHYEKHMLNSDIVEMIERKGYSKEVITADSAEPKSIEELKRSGIRRVKAARKGKDSVLHGIQFIQQFELIVHPRCTNFHMELENYTWKKDKFTNEYMNTPIDSFNHLLDAMRYALEDVMPRNRMSSINKTTFGF